MSTPEELIAQAQRADGLPYRLGTETNLHSDEMPKAFDCSELVEWSCARVGVFIPDGTVNQWPWCRDHGTLIPVGDAIATPGALLFVWDGANAGAGHGNHVAISRGDGTTIEARGTKYGCGNWTAMGRGWTHGALIPGLDYSQPTEADMDAETFARATGANYNPGTGQITLTLVETYDPETKTVTYQEYPFATALVFIHQELKMARLRG